MQMLLGHAAGGDRRSKSRIRDESLARHAQNLFTQRADNQIAGREDAADKSDLKALVLHLQLADDRDGGSAEFGSGFAQDLPRDFIAVPRGVNDIFAEGGDA